MRNPWKIVKKPLVTEKSMSRMQDRNSYTFIVDIQSNKLEIKHAVEKAFSVKVAKVRTMVIKGKVKMMKNQVTSGKRKDVKKAYVTLQEGHRLDII